MYIACTQSERKELKVSSADAGGHTGDSVAIIWDGWKVLLVLVGGKALFPLATGIFEKLLHTTFFSLSVLKNDQTLYYCQPKTVLSCSTLYNSRNTPQFVCVNHVFLTSFIFQFLCNIHVPLINFHWLQVNRVRVPKNQPLLLICDLEGLGCANKCGERVWWVVGRRTALCYTGGKSGLCGPKMPLLNLTLGWF